MAHDDKNDGDDTNPHTVPTVTPAPTGADSTDAGEAGPTREGGEETGPWILGDHHAVAVGELVGAMEASPAAGTLFGAIQSLPQEQQQELSSAVRDALREAYRQGSGQQLPLPDLYIMIPVAYWCPKAHLLFPYETLTTAEGLQCPDHHEELEPLYTRKRQG